MPIKAKWVSFRTEIIEALSTTETGVYEIGKARGSVVLYIGKSDKSIRSRLLDHKGKVAFVDCSHFRKRKTTPKDAAKAEERLLSEYKRTHGQYPKLNKNKPPTPSKNIPTKPKRKKLPAKKKPVSMSKFLFG